MGFLDRIRRLVRAGAHDLLKRAEDPAKVLDQIILDMTNQLNSAKRSVALAIAEEKRLERMVAVQQPRGQEWEDRALVALKAGREELALQALARKSSEEQHTLRLQEQHTKQHDAVDGLKQSLRDLQIKIDDARQKKVVLVARARHAEAARQVQQLVSGIGNTSAFEAFDEMAARVEQLELENQALAEATERPETLESEIDRLAAGISDDTTRAIGGDAVPPDGLNHSLEELKRRLREESV